MSVFFLVLVSNEPCFRGEELHCGRCFCVRDEDDEDGGEDEDGDGEDGGGEDDGATFDDDCEEDDGGALIG